MATLLPSPGLNLNLDRDLDTTPIGFVEGILGLSLYPWQDRALTPLELATGPRARRTKISLVTPNGAGKSERVVAGAALWWAAAHARGKVVITSKDSKQLTQQIVPAIDRHVGRLGGWRAVHSPYYLVRTPTGGSIHAFVTSEGTRFEGWHKEDDTDGPLLIIVDEAKSVPEPIFQGADRCTFNALLYCSSPGIMQGRFYDSHTRHRDQFHCVQAGLIDCPHIPRAKVEDILRGYGERHPFTRSSVYGEFMEQEDDAAKFVVGLAALQRCLRNPPDPREGIVAAFCDFAAGGDENVVAVRRGNRVEIAAAWREADKRAAVGRFLTEFRRARLAPEQVWCDASDKDMADLLAGAGWRVNRQNFGAPASNPEMYVSWGAEAWHETGLAIERCEVILPGGDAVLHAQLTTRQKGINARGRLCLEDKFAMRRRRLPSPDRADAVCGVLNVRDYSALTSPPAFPEFDAFFLTGADAGY